MQRSLLLLAIALLSSLLGVATAQEKLMDIEQSGFQPPVQTGRPIPTWWDVTVRQTGLVEGRFEFVLRHEGVVLATVKTEELALTGPQQQIKVLFPPIERERIIDQLQVDVSFKGAKHSQTFNQQTLRVPMARTKTFLVLKVESRISGWPREMRDQFQRSLSFESMIDERYLGSTNSELIKTIYVSLEPGDLPNEPIPYCAYEMIVIPKDEFRLAKKTQLEAIAAWVRAGGSLFVEPTGVLELYHLEFLRGLAALDGREITIAPDSKGKLVPGTVWQEAQFIPLKTGLGNTVLWVHDDKPHVNFAGAEWRAAVSALWRMRSFQRPALAKTGRIAGVPVGGTSGLPFHDQRMQFQMQANPGFPMAVPGGGGVIPAQPPIGPAPAVADSAGDSGLAWVGMPIKTPDNYTLQFGWMGYQLPTSTNELLEQLMPKGVRMVPLWLLALILSGFVLAIGPGDYFGLGLLKLRKFTWVTFPLVTLFVTGLTVWVTNQYMSTAEARRAIIMRDIVDDGSIARTNRFELLFISSSRRVKTNITKGVFTALKVGASADQRQRELEMAQNSYQQRPRRPGFGMSQLSDKNQFVHYDGRIPTEYTITQELSKWTPQLNRIFSIPGPAEESPFKDWNELTDGLFPTSAQLHTGFAEVERRVREKIHTDALCAVIGPRGQTLYTDQRWATGLGTMDPLMVQQRQQAIAYSQQVYGEDFDSTHGLTPPEVARGGELIRWLYLHSVTMPRGLFGLMSATGPKGSIQLDDLPIYDTSRTDQGLLIVVVPSGDDFVVYRKLFNIGDRARSVQE